MVVLAWQNPALWSALVPLGGYLMVVGLAQMRRRPVVLTGFWDSLLLMVAVSGLLVVGPLALLRPGLGESPWAWVILGLLTSLVIAVSLLVSRPRLVIYNATLEQVRPLVAEITVMLDPAARWAGESASLPGRGLQLHLEDSGPLRVVSVWVMGQRNTPEAWGDFCRLMRRECRRLRGRSNPWAVAFLGAGLSVWAVSVALALGLNAMLLD
jgi:hypothetical protein